MWGIAAPARSTLVVDDDGVGLEASGYAARERLGLRLCERLLQKLRLETRAELVLLALSSRVVGGAG